MNGNMLNLPPVGSIHGIFTFIYHKNQPFMNVGKYTIFPWMVATKFDVHQRLPTVIHATQIPGTSCRCCLSEFRVVAGEFRWKGFKVEIMCGNMF